MLEKKGGDVGVSGGKLRYLRGTGFINRGGKGFEGALGDGHLGSRVLERRSKLLTHMGHGEHI